MNTTYREQFTAPEKAAEYEGFYTKPGYAQILWEVEKEFLADIITRYREKHDHIDYLDFASGTGRVISFMEDKVDSARGIEISDSMAAIAREKLSNGEIVVKDITADDDEIEAKYDVITTFRFILNAEPTLRLKAMQGLVNRLKNENSILIFNNHGAMFSHKFLLWPYHKLRSIGKGWETEGNYLRGGQVKQLAKQLGLEIEEVHGCGVLSAKAIRLMSYDKAQSMEKKIARGALLPKLGVNQLYVARLAKSSD